MNLPRRPTRRNLAAVAVAVLMIGVVTVGAWAVAGLRVRWDGPGAQEPAAASGAGLWRGRVDTFGTPDPLHVVVSLDYLDRSETLTEQDLAITPPFERAADVVDREGHRVAVSVDQQRTDGDVTTRSTTYWSAERIG